MDDRSSRDINEEIEKWTHDSQASDVEIDEEY